MPSNDLGILDSFDLNITAEEFYDEVAGQIFDPEDINEKTVDSEFF